MKFEKNKKYFTISIYAFGVIAASMLLLFWVLYPEKISGAIGKFFSIIAPLIIGFGIAFVLNPILNFFEKKLFSKILNKKKEKKGKRALSLLCTYAIFLGLVSTFIAIVLPSVIESVTDLINNVQGYYSSGIEFAKELLLKFNIPSDFLEPFTDIGSKLVEILVKTLQTALPQLYGIAVGATSVVKNTIVGFIFSIYMLTSKEIFRKQFDKVIKTFAKEKTQNRIRCSCEKKFIDVIGN